MPGLTFFVKLWICRSMLRHTLTICAILNFNNDINLRAPPRRQSKPNKIDVYWNIPTFQCNSHKLNFTTLADKYGFIQNPNDTFWGKNVNILYDPGNFPAILKNTSTTVKRNGGVPQEGNLTDHILLFNEFLDKMVPDQTFSGVGIIDFESWRPIFRQNFGKLTDYRTLSISIEKQNHPTWANNQLEKEATRRFESGARKFMENTLLAAKNARPYAIWGYYAYPYCFNMSPNNKRKQCPKEVLAENDRLKWLFQRVDNFYPSLYFEKVRLSANDKVQLIEGRINESMRIIKNISKRKKIIPYFWFKYQDKQEEFVSKEDLFNSFSILASSNISGLIIWGSSNDVNTKKKCFELYQYIDNLLGPLLAHIF